ncbi:hypothetical protein ACFQ1Q_04740 [Winogradskyella litorisediminis]|uniref:Uncharacterized protein n=1 Tax=Winogradskyella litorisediminis TaxID=1156618 RepID=A0ABW3N4F2_9FLAO
MKLTKEEIKFIDNYLIKNEVKFWDVRLELLDHIVSAVEDKIENEGISFNEALLDVHYSFGNQPNRFERPKDKIFTKGLYGNTKGFKEFTRQKQKALGSKQRKLYWRTFPSYLITSRCIIELVAVVLTIFTIFQFHQKTAFIVAMILSLLPEFLKIFPGVFRKASKHSLRAQMAFNISALFMSLNYFWLAGFNEIFEDQQPKPYIYGIIFYLVLFVFLRHGYNVYKQIMTENNYEYKSMIA